MKESITKLHMLCEDWKRELHFFKDELPFLRKRLDEVVFKNTDKDILVFVEQFENKFRIMSNNIDELLHDVKLKTENLSSQAAAKANYINVKMIEADHSLEELMHQTSKEFYDLRRDYYKFLSRVL